MAEDMFLQANARRQIEKDIDARVSIHKANVARLAASADTARAMNVTEANRPLVMLAQGDSWFDYPLTGNGMPLTDTDVIAKLRRVGGMPPTILNLAHHGDSATDEMSLPKQTRITKELRDKTNWLNGKPDAILFSAGGNDIAGNNFCIFLDFNDGRVTGITPQRFAGALGMVEACYLALFALRDRVAPGVPIFGHCYDFPIPNGAHPYCLGPWLKPSLDFCNWSVAQGRVIIKDALVAFRAMLKRLADDPKNDFYLVDTQGILTDAEWANELHPYPGGFQKIAQAFADALEQKFAAPLA